MYSFGFAAVIKSAIPHRSSVLLNDPLRDLVTPSRHLFYAIGLALQIIRGPQSRLPDGRITGPLGEFPIPTGKRAQFTRILHGALLVVSPILRS
jgi:hypothetical protein